MELLRKFNDDKRTKEELLEYLVTHFQRKIVERALKKENTDSLADAILELESGFSNLDIDYGLPRQETIKTNSAK